MELFPADLRCNLATWAVPLECYPAVGNWMDDLLPSEPYDPHFRGQRLETVYFDTADFALRKARRGKQRYLTLRVRCYASESGDAYALSAKTESEKWRREITSGLAHRLLDETATIAEQLPAHLAARLAELAGGGVCVPVVTVCCRRYAVEDDSDRFTFDVDVHTERGKRLPYGVLEYKSFAAVERVVNLPPGLRPLKISKFLWSTKP
jgi:hypothetical protein